MGNSFSSLPKTVIPIFLTVNLSPTADITATRRMAAILSVVIIGPAPLHNSSTASRTPARNIVIRKGPPRRPTSVRSCHIRGARATEGLLPPDMEPPREEGASERVGDLGCRHPAA